MHTTVKNSSLQQDDLHHVWHPFHQASTYQDIQFLAVAGEGPYLIDDSGRRYLDAISGLWAVSLGYSDQRVINAIIEQLKKLPALSLIVGSHEPSIKLAAKLARLAPGRLNVVFFTSGGSEGVETAIKLARHVAMVRKEPSRRKILALQGAYHGMSYGALSATGITADRWQFGVLLPEIVHCASPYTLLRSGRVRDSDEVIKEVERTLDFHGPDTFAAILVEPVIGVGGMIPPPPGYLRALRELCSNYSILLVFDEVVTGCGRTGEWFAADKFHVIPDMIVLAKGLTSGYIPLGAVLIDETIFEICETDPSASFMHGFTFGGSPAACSAALACLEVIEDHSLLEKVVSDGAFFLEQFQAVARALPCVREIRGIGLMLAVDFWDPSGPNGFVSPEFGKIVRRVARDNGVIVRPTYGGTTFNFAPPFICTHDELRRIAAATGDGVEAALRNGG